MRKINFWIFFIAVAADQATKYLASAFLLRLSHGNAGTEFFSFALHHNYGLSFSLLKDSPYIGLFCSLAVWTVLLIFLFTPVRRRTFLSKIKGGVALSLLLAGAAGNIIDRVRYLYVIDWFYVGVYINLADVFISLGAGLLLLRYFSQRGETLK